MTPDEIVMMLRAEAQFQRDRFSRGMLADELTAAADLIESLQAELEIYRGLPNEPLTLDELLDLLAAKDAEIARLTAERDAIKQSCDGLCASHDNVYARLTAMAARAEKAEVERDAAVDERDTLMRRHAKQVEVIRHKIDDGGFSPDEQSLLDDLMLPRHFDRRGAGEG